MGGSPRNTQDVGKIKRMGADGVKLMLWYRADAGLAERSHQQEFARHVGEECRKYDIPFLLELLVYPFLGEDNHTTDYREDDLKRPELVLEGLSHFADHDKFGVDIHKVESPVAARLLPDPHSPESTEAQAWFDRIPTIIEQPWVLLSAGADMAQFERVLTFAYRSGASGYLAGRAIWWPAFQAMPDLAAMRMELESAGRRYQSHINTLTDSLAKPWRSVPWYSDGATLKDAGPDFPKVYSSL